MIELLNCDCMDYMKTLEDKAFDLAIVDPPYGIERFTSADGGQSKRFKGFKKSNKWNNTKPTSKYFDELFRVSKNQIVWGGNFFYADICKSTRGFIVWDKKQPWPNFSACEYAWNSIDGVSKIFSYRNNGHKIHPTQKPVKLYDWLLKNYAKEGDRILDTHLGSGSSAIAAHYGGFDFVGCELDKDYFEAAKKRFDEETRQEELCL